MEGPILWEKIAKYLSGNYSEAEKADIEKYINRNGNSILFRDASTLFGKSSQEIQDLFKKLDQELKK